MSKRAGTFITLDELLAEIGVDAARWFFASRGPSSAIDFDIELAKKQSNENPVYYVQYAHARIASILRKAADAGLVPAERFGPSDLADGPGGRRWSAAIARLPEVVEDAAAAEEAQGITAYATELASTFHAFYRDAKVVDPAEPEPFGGPSRPRRGDEDHAGERARPARDLGARADVARPASRPGRAAEASPEIVGSSVAMNRVTRSVPSMAIIACAPPIASSAVCAAAANSAASAGVSQRVSMTAPARSPFVTSATRSPPQPGGRGRRGRRGDLAGRLQPHAELELAERVLHGDRPAGPEPRREVLRERDRDRRLAGGVLVGVEDLLGRGRRLGVQGVDRRPAARGLGGRARAASPCSIGEQERLLEDRRHLVEDLLLLRVARLRDHVAASRPATVACCAQRVISRVASPSATARWASEASPWPIDSRARFFRPKFWSWRAWSYSWAKTNFSIGSETARLRHHEQLLGVGVVVAGDLAAEQLDVEVGQRGAGRDRGP